MKTLADTSAWIEYLSASGSATDRRMRELMQTREELCVSEPVIAELLVGPKDDVHATHLREFLSNFHHLPCHGAIDFDGAIRIYRGCRRKGVTPRDLLDCMIANVAQRHGTRLLAFDRDMAHIAEVMEIELDPASLR